MSGATVLLDGLSVSFGATLALDCVSLECEPGRIHALLGPSGCGKTTLLRAMAGLTVPAAGRVWLDGEDVTLVPTERRGLVLVHQDALLFPSMTVLANVAFPAKARGEPRSVAEAAARQALAQVRLERLERRLPRELSGGERQRVALARALMARPRVLLLDEPLGALDAGLREELRELIAELQRASALTTVVVTHDQREAASLAHRISVLEAGRILQTGTPAELYRAPASEAVARFLGATNLFEARVTGGVAVCPLGELAVQLQEGPALLCIWPQDVGLGAGPNPLVARVERLVFTGAEQRVRLAVGEAALEVLAPRWLRLSVGERLEIHLPPDRIVLVPR